MSDGKRDFEARAVDRLIFFSDAVVAIAITLLAIDLPVPTGDTVSEFWSSVRHNAGHCAPAVPAASRQTAIPRDHIAPAGIATGISGLREWLRRRGSHDLR